MTGIERIFRAEYGRAVAVLIRHFGDIAIAEEAVQDAFVTAVRLWPEQGVPPSPAGWIITTARNRAVDRIRREAARGEREAAAVREEAAAAGRTRGEAGAGGETGVPGDGNGDDRLRLIFTCCHPSLAPEARVALTLRLLGGLTTGEIARAFLVPETTMGQRLSRAKGKIRDAGIPYRVPADDELAPRLGAVLAVLYLIFNEGYAASTGDELTRADLTAEAIRLARMLVVLLPDEPEPAGLLALMLLVESRRPARTGPGGDPIRLADQDRGCWDRRLIDEGQRVLRDCLRRNRPGPYQLQAAINAVHADAGTAAETDWRQILVLYDLLAVLTPTPVVALHRAVAFAEVHGPGPALAIVDGLTGLDRHHVRHAVRADLLRRLDRTAEAAGAYRRAAELAGNAAERRFLTARAEELTGSGPWSLLRP
ncbi:RNA polymerase subunit sigma-24 [Paractinoplanes rishiriensis]|uniref:RNA polymerase subunit sigma-24 n=2 Tax=Paractinoplanes rishiriensis TaxID=1050105 RepID=A0A919JUL1_9ACTN|nr:RNA polymerase subunit sigma-24 [Actinoplanes rishiriensis]